MQSVTDFPWEFAHITETTLVQTGATVLHTLTINRGASQGTIVATVYDGADATGTIVAIIDVGDTVVTPTTLAWGIALETGLYIVVSSSEVSVDLTVSFK
uniref:Uncharacterized protein n=1 Tax=viral metagenome TaxID=1070528 RepID=A0A6H1Z8B5_9ZZZZ